MSEADIAQSSSLISNLMSGLVGAFIGGVFSLYGTRKILNFEAKNRKQSQDIDLILKFDDRFNDDTFRKIRAAAAKSINSFRAKLSDKRSADKALGKTTDPDILLQNIYNISDVKEDAFDFFEGLGLLFRRYQIDKELVWSCFSPWVNGYWQSAKEYILEAQKEDDTVWEDFKNLYDRLAEVEKKRCKLADGDLIWDDKDINVFLESELRL